MAWACHGSDGLRWRQQVRPLNVKLILDVIRGINPARTRRKSRRLHIKAVDLEIRPIHNCVADRVRAHALLCMLAYDLEWHVRQALTLHRRIRVPRKGPRISTGETTIRMHRLIAASGLGRMAPLDYGFLRWKREVHTMAF